MNAKFKVEKDRELTIKALSAVVEASKAIDAAQHAAEVESFGSADLSEFRHYARVLKAMAQALENSLKKE